MNEDIAKIQAMYQRWGQAVQSQDIDGYISCLDKNITMRPPGGPTIEGHDNYRVFLKPVFDAATYDSEREGDHEIEIFGDFAIARARTTIRLKYIDGATSVASDGAIQKEVSTSDYLDVLKRQDDGEWKCLVHTWQEIESA